MKFKMGICLRAILVSIFGAFLLFGSISYWYISKQNKAIAVAQEYLHQKYTEDIKFSSIRFSWVDPCFYHVNFSLKNTPTVIFEVLVNPDLSISPDKDGESSDNYYISLFEHNAEVFLAEEVKKLWGADAEINLNVKQKGLYTYLIPDKVNEKLSLTEMALLFDDYSISVIDNAFSSDTITLDVEKLFGFVQFLKQNGFNPQMLCFSGTDATRTVRLINIVDE